MDLVEDGIHQFDLWDLQGRKVKHSTFNGKGHYQFEVGHNKGVFILTVHSNNQRFTQKVTLF